MYGLLSASNNAKSGEKIFLSKCAQCHALDTGAGRRQGPNLNGLLGRTFGGTPGYSYSEASKNMLDVWEEPTLHDYMLDSKKHISGMRMDFSSVSRPQEDKDLTVYLEEKKTCLSITSPHLVLKNEIVRMQRYIPRTGSEFLTSDTSNIPTYEMEKESPRYHPKHLISLLIGSIRSLSMQGHLSKAFKSFSLLQIHSSSSILFPEPIPDSISTLLSVSTNLKAVQQGKQLHAHIISLGLHNNPFLISRLCAFYPAVGLIDDAETIVQDSSTKHARPWNLLIDAYIQNGFWLDAIFAYKKMVARGCKADIFTYPSILKACSQITDLDLGMKIHGRIEISGLQHDLFIHNALISMYAKCGMIKVARQVFDSMYKKDIVTWNSLISGYSSSGMWKESVDMLDKMQSYESKVNTVTLNTIATAHSHRGCHIEALGLISYMKNNNLSIDSTSLVIGMDSCSRIGHLRVGKEIHALALRLRYTELENVSNALITMYSRCKKIEVAFLLFRMRTYKSLICWNAMIAGFADVDQEKETFLIFQEMVMSQTQPTYVTIMPILSLCSRATNLQYGRELHCYIVKHKHKLKNFQLLCNSLINMYSKSGSILVAERVFDMMGEHDIVSYTSMIDGYGMRGHGMKALDLFNEMICCGIKPDGITMLAVLSACSHSGLIAQGEMLFGKMVSTYEISPQMEHYSCMVDLFTRAGLLINAENVIDQMPSEPTTSMLATLIMACQTYGNVEIGERAAKMLLELGSNDQNHYVLIANMFAYCANWEESTRVETSMQDMGLIDAHLLLGGLFQHLRDVGYSGYTWDLWGSFLHRGNEAQLH